MFRLIAMLSVGVALLLAVVCAPAFMFDEPAAADDAFPQDVIFQAEPLYEMSMPMVWAEFGLTPEEGDGRGIITGERTPDGGSPLQIIDPGKDGNAALKHLSETGWFDPRYGPSRTIYPDRVTDIAQFDGELMLHPDTRKQAVATFSFGVARGLEAIDPKPCQTLVIESDLLSMLGALPEAALLCDALAEGQGQDTRFVLSVYKVDRGPLPALYMAVTCALLNDAIFAKRGAQVVGREHVCLALRVGGVPIADQVAVRHYRIARPAPTT